MAWVRLVEGVTWDEAHRMAAQYELSCVSVRQFRYYEIDRAAKPIVRRTRVMKHWCNYYEDGTYNKTNAKGDMPVYTPCIFVPDKISYVDFLSFARQHLKPLKGVYAPYILYLTEAKGSVMYSVYDAILQTSIDVPFDNDMLYFEHGAPKSTAHCRKKER